MHDPRFLQDFICALKIFTKVSKCPGTFSGTSRLSTFMGYIVEMYGCPNLHAGWNSRICCKCWLVYPNDRPPPFLHALRIPSQLCLIVTPFCNLTCAIVVCPLKKEKGKKERKKKKGKRNIFFKHIIHTR